jgi:hypothetical protein
MCGRMNQCIIGGVGDGDSGKDGGDEQRGARAAGIMGEHRPLAPSFMSSWEPSPMEMGSMGEAKTWL